MYELKPTRQLLTSYYISIIFTTYILRLIPNQMDIWLNWLISFLKSSVNLQINTTGGVWVCLFFLCFFIVWLMRKFVVEPLGFYVNGKATSAFELLLLMIFILGFFIYSINVVFPEYQMPAFVPGPLLNILGSSSNTLRSISVEERNLWSIVPWLWYFGPIAVMYSMFINEKIHSSEE